jgi:hypothetical protein
MYPDVVVLDIESARKISVVSKGVMAALNKNGRMMKVLIAYRF